MLEALPIPGVAYPTLILLALASLMLLLGRTWRWLAGALAAQYIGVFILTAFSWPLVVALVKLVAGWMAVLVLWVTIANTPGSWPEEQPQAANQVFRILAAGNALLVMIAVGQGVANWIPQVDTAIISGALIVMGLGLLHLGLTVQPLRVIISLLTILSGFEILYAALENSLLVAGLLAALNLGIALIGAYIAVLPFFEEEPL